MNIYTIDTQSEHETKEIAETLAPYLNPGDVLTLEGDLGAGKTAFTKGIAKGLGIESIVSSPTFTIIKEYHGELPLYHMDAYRLEHSEEDIGFIEYFEGDGISVVEWAQFIKDYLPEERLNIKMTFITGESRRLEFHPRGDHFKHILHQFFNKR